MKTLAKNAGLEGDISGCYVLFDKGRPVYTGISRGILGRLKQHVCGTTHFDASLAYKMAAKEIQISKTRAEAMKDPQFITAFEEAQRYLKTLSVSFVEIPNSLVRYVFEPYCALHLNTGTWNTFETH